MNVLANRQNDVLTKDLGQVTWPLRAKKKRKEDNNTHRKAERKDRHADGREAPKFVPDTK